MLLSFIHPNLEIDYGSEPFRTVQNRSKGRTELPEPINIGLVWFGYFCGLVPVWTGSEPNRGNTRSILGFEDTIAGVMYELPSSSHQVRWSSKAQDIETE